MQKLGRRPALIIHSRDDSQVPHASHERIMASAPAHVESWVREGDLHCIGHPEVDESVGRIIGFLERHFGE
jgi:hypothetical protein